MYKFYIFKVKLLFLFYLSQSFKEYKLFLLIYFITDFVVNPLMPKSNFFLSFI